MRLFLVVFCLVAMVAAKPKNRVGIEHGDDKNCKDPMELLLQLCLKLDESAGGADKRSWEDVFGLLEPVCDYARNTTEAYGGKRGKQEYKHHDGKNGGGKGGDGDGNNHRKPTPPVTPRMLDPERRGGVNGGNKYDEDDLLRLFAKEQNDDEKRGHKSTKGPFTPHGYGGKRGKQEYKHHDGKNGGGKGDDEDGNNHRKPTPPVTPRMLDPERRGVANGGNKYDEDDLLRLFAKEQNDDEKRGHKRASGSTKGPFTPHVGVMGATTNQPFGDNMGGKSDGDMGSKPDGDMGSKPDGDMGSKPDGDMGSKSDGDMGSNSKPDGDMGSKLYGGKRYKQNGSMRGLPDDNQTKPNQVRLLLKICEELAKMIEEEEEAHRSVRSFDILLLLMAEVCQAASDQVEAGKH